MKLISFFFWLLFFSQSGVAQSQVQNCSKLYSPPTLSLRYATQSDVDSLLEIDAASFDPNIRYSREVFEKYVADTNSKLILAIHGGKIAGAGIVTLNASADEALIASLAVFPAFRRMGIGEELMKRMLSELAVQTKKRVILEVETTNSGAMKLYEKFGFHPTRTLKDYYGPDRPAYEMVHVQR